MIYHEREDTMRKRADVLERGLLIDGKSVPASSGKLANDVSPWDGEIYARVAAARRRTSPETSMQPWMSSHASGQG